MSVVGGGFGISAGEERCERECVAHCRNISSDGAIAEGDEGAGARAEKADFVLVFVGADGAFDEGDVDVFRKMFLVDDGGADEIREFPELEDALVDIEEGHVAAGAAVEPNGGESWFAHRVPSRISLR